MDKHFAQLAEEHFNSGLTRFNRILDLVRGATCLGMYNYWTAQYHKVGLVTQGEWWLIRTARLIDGLAGVGHGRSSESVSASRRR